MHEYIEMLMLPINFVLNVSLHLWKCFAWENWWEMPAAACPAHALCSVWLIERVRPQRSINRRSCYCHRLLGHATLLVCSRSTYWCSYMVVLPQAVFIFTLHQKSTHMVWFSSHAIGCVQPACPTQTLRLSPACHQTRPEQPNESGTHCC